MRKLLVLSVLALVACDNTPEIKGPDDPTRNLIVQYDVAANVKRCWVDSGGAAYVRNGSDIAWEDSYGNSYGVAGNVGFVRGAQSVLPTLARNIGVGDLSMCIETL